MRLSIGNHQINIEESGNANGPAVVMGHSLGCNLRMWDPQMAVLEPHYRVVRIDMRGHGDSDAPSGPYTLDELADDVIGVLDALSIERCHWVGLSIGGMYGQSLLLRHPQRFLSAVLCDTASALPPEALAAWDDRIHLIEQNGLSSIIDATMERWFTQPFIDANSAEFQAVKEQMQRANQRGYLGCVAAIKGLNTIDRLATIEHPIRIIVGRDDLATPVAAAEAINARIKGSDLVIIDNASHICNVEQRDIFNKALMDFLRQQA